MRADLRYGGLVERHDDLTIGIHALVDFDAQLARYQRLERAEHAVRLRARAPAELQRVAEAARGDQPDPRHLALEQRIGRGRRAVDDEVEVGWRNAGGADCRKDAFGLVRQRCQHLGEADLVAGRIAAMQKQIGEGAADVDTGRPFVRPPGRRVIGTLAQAAAPASRSESRRWQGWLQSGEGLDPSVANAKKSEA